MSSDLPAMPNIQKGIKDQIEILLPSNPIRVGKTTDGQSVFFDPKDLILSPDQKLEQSDTMKRGDRESALHAARLNLACRVQMWMDLTFRRIAPKAALVSQEATQEWIKAHDVNFIEDSSVPDRHKFVLRIGDRPVSEFIGKLEMTPISN